jgi:hypothetical protein
VPLSGLEYFVLADLDNDSTTGGGPAVLGIPTDFQGAELVTRVAVSLLIESPERTVVTPTLWKFQNGAFVEVSDPSITARIDQIVGGVDAPIENGEGEEITHTSDAVVIEFSNEVRGEVKVPFRVQALSQGFNIVDRLDDRPGEPGREFRLRHPTFPTCSVRPDAVLPRGTATVDVTGLLPNRGTHVVFGDKLVATGSTGAEGEASIPFIIPIDAREGLHLVTVGSDGTGLTADCSVMVVAPAVVNALVSFDPLESTFMTTADTTGCPAEFVGKFSFDARLTNKSSSPPLSDLMVQVATLTNRNLLQNADGGPGGAGAMLTVPPKDGFADGVLSPEEFVDVPFVICLKEDKPFSFFVDVLGEVVEGGE